VIGAGPEVAGAPGGVRRAEAGFQYTAKEDIIAYLEPKTPRWLPEEVIMIDAVPKTMCV
jgi:hypothetical protein